MGDLFFLISGIVLATVTGIILIMKLIVDLSCSKRVEARISGIHTESTLIRGSTLHTYSPEYEFYVEGKKYAGTAHVSSARENKYRVGDSITLYYHPRNPELVRVPHFSWGILVAFVLFAFGVTEIVCYFL